MKIRVPVALLTAATLLSSPALAQEVSIGSAILENALGVETKPAPIACSSDEIRELFPLDCGEDANGVTRSWFLPGPKTEKKPKPPAVRSQAPRKQVVSNTSGAKTVVQPSTERKRAPVAAPTVAACAVDDVDVIGANLCATFARGSAQLTPHARETLDSFAAAIRSDPRAAGRKFLVEGHADATGTAESNRALSEARARAVVSYLTARGVSAERLGAEGFGAEHPVVGRDPYDPVNRRVQVRVVQS
jgi:outer membrane protein OmpA-like peptidoglycan-associated protein